MKTLGSGLGKKLKALRQAKNWSQEETAHRLNLSLPAYSKIERGVSDVSLTRLEELGKLFNLNVIGLLSYGEKNLDKGCKELLAEKDKEIMKLQKRVIDLIDKKK